MQVVTLDFETFYSTEFSLSKLATSEYVQHPEFLVHGASIKIDEAPARWVSRAQLEQAFNEIDWKNTILVGHNLQFDGYILWYCYGIVPAKYADTLAMARGTHPHHMRFNLNELAQFHGLKGKEKRAALANTQGKRELTPEEDAALGAYAIDDVEDTYTLYKRMRDSLSTQEMDLIHLTTRMFCEPVLELDEERVEKELEREVTQKQAAIAAAGVLMKTLQSAEQFANALRDLGVEPPLKVSLRTGKITYAFAKADPEFTALLHHPDERVVKLVTARLKAKSTGIETRARRFVTAAKAKKLPIGLNYCGAHTHRWSGGNKMNVQNLKRGGELRRSILAPPGYVVVAVDSAQIEARFNAWLAREQWVINAFAAGRDLYSEFATDIYGRPIDRKRAAVNEAGEYVDKEGRVVATKEHAFFPDALEGFVGKCCVLGLGFQMGAKKFHGTMKAGVMGPPLLLPMEFCVATVDLYRKKHPQIVRQWRTFQDIITLMAHGSKGEYRGLQYGRGFIKKPNGMYLMYPGLEAEETHLGISYTYQTRTGRSKIYGGLLDENVVQSLARDCVAEQMLLIDALPNCRVVTMTHDEVVFITPEREADEMLAQAIKIMSTPPSWAPGVPLAAEGGYDRSYSK